MAITDQHGRRLVSISLEQRKELRKRYIAQTPWWRHPLLGYILSLPLIGVAVAGTMAIQAALGSLYFHGALFILVILFVALFWGAGPALLTLLASTVALNYYFIPPTGQFTFQSWQGALQLLPFVVSGLTIALITAQRERARLGTLAIEQELQEHAEELEVTNRKLEDVSQAKDRFLSMASHELKTPITTIRGQAQLMLRRLAKEGELSSEVEDMHKALTKIDEQTNRLTIIIDELLDISGIRTRKLTLHKKDCDIVDLCKGVVEDQRMLTSRQITLNFAPEHVNMQIDCDRIAQVLINLVSNAIKYSPESSPLEVSVKQLGRNVLIQVRDYGKGIAKSDQARIFDAFYRTSEAQASPKVGLGLGLAISKDIVERHNGRIWLESEKGKGSTFFVELPLK